MHQYFFSKRIINSEQATAVLVMTHEVNIGHFVMLIMLHKLNCSWDFLHFFSHILFPDIFLRGTNQFYPV